MSEKPVRTINDAYVVSIKNFYELSDEELKESLEEYPPPPDDQEISEEEYQRLIKMNPWKILEGEIERILSIYDKKDK
jgi:hypothetical protein